MVMAGRGVNAQLGLGPLTRTQGEVLRRAALGHTYGMIADDLFISEHTVKNHMQAVYRRTNSHCLTDALRAVGWLVVP